MTTNKTPAAPGRPALPDLDLSRFDRTVLIAIVALLGTILLLVALGDNVGVRVLRTAPGDEARSTAAITLQFSEDMDRPSVEARLQVTADSGGEPLAGTFNWVGKTVYFRPDEAFHPGQGYTARLETGSLSVSGRTVLAEQTIHFRVRRPKIAYLAPADDAPRNVWVADPDNLDDTYQLTFSEGGMLNFDISPDGRQMVFSEQTVSGTAELYVMNLDDGSTRQISDCADAYCTTPVWRPDGQMIAYERVDFNSDLPASGPGPSRVWLIDLSSATPQEYPLFSDSQMLGHSAEWAADGSRIAVYDSSSRGILIYTFATEGIAFIPTQMGLVGTFSPDGNQMVYPELVNSGTLNVGQLFIADLETSRITALTPEGEVVDDGRAVWSPSGDRIVVSRNYLNDPQRSTSGRQLFSIDPATGESEPLIYDPDYYHSYFAWDPSGDQMAIHRVPQARSDSSGQAAPIRPEIWVYNMTTGDLLKVADNAYFPRWLP